MKSKLGQEYPSKQSARWVSFKKVCPLNYIERAIYSAASRQPRTNARLGKYLGLDYRSIAKYCKTLQDQGLIEQRHRKYFGCCPTGAAIEWFSWPEKLAKEEKWQDRLARTPIFVPSHRCPLNYRQVVLYCLLFAGSIKRKSVRNIARLMGCSPTTISNDLKTLKLHSLLANHNITLPVPKPVWFRDKANTAIATTPLGQLMHQHGYPAEDNIYIVQKAKHLSPLQAENIIHCALKEHKTAQAKGQYLNLRSPSRLARHKIDEAVKQAAQQRERLLNQHRESEEQRYWTRRAGYHNWSDRHNLVAEYGQAVVEAVLDAMPESELGDHKALIKRLQSNKASS